MEFGGLNYEMLHIPPYIWSYESFLKYVWFREPKYAKKKHVYASLPDVKFLFKRSWNCAQLIGFRSPPGKHGLINAINI